MRIFATLLPRHVHALARLFPAIGRLQVVSRLKQHQALPADADALAQHYSGAGNDEMALVYTERAADQAVSGLAFDHAASIYEHILSLLVESDPKQGEILTKLAQALADAGRSRESAKAYLRAADWADEDTRFERYWQAAKQALIGGDFDTGIPLLKKNLPHFGIKLPSSTLGVVNPARWAAAWFPGFDGGHR